VHAVLHALDFLPVVQALASKPPLSDGLYLSYDYGGSNLQVTFYEIDAGSFYAALSSGSEAESEP